MCTSLCRSPDECQSGELCLSGRCVVLACGPSGPACGGGEVCDVQLEVGRLRGPAALESNGVTVLYAELGASDGSSSIIRAESEDGVRFQTEPDVAVVTPDPDQTSVGAPGPVAIDGEVHLFYEVDDGASIARRIAPDGQSFGPATTVLVPTEAWEAGRVGAPAAARVGTRTMLFYEGGDAQGIGFAVAESGVFLRVNAPVLRAVDFDSPPEWRGVERLGQPWAVVVDSLLGDRTLRLFVSGVGVENTAPRQADGGPPARNLSIGVAIAPAASEPPELEVWPFNPVLGELEALAPAAESSPTVVRVGTEWRMYFESPSGLSMAAHPPRPTR